MAKIGDHIGADFNDAAVAEFILATALVDIYSRRVFFIVPPAASAAASVEDGFLLLEFCAGVFNFGLTVYVEEPERQLEFHGGDRHAHSVTTAVDIYAPAFGERDAAALHLCGRNRKSDACGALGIGWDSNGGIHCLRLFSEEVLRRYIQHARKPGRTDMAKGSPPSASGGWQRPRVGWCGVKWAQVAHVRGGGFWGVLLMFWGCFGVVLGLFLGAGNGKSDFRARGGASRGG